ncbi:hypothetical protein, partial [Longimicrobium sp.]|uniref:hypothetical protein n=1 Tax=Longimicrobium sp. TaxID=2029185 RepID=UPI002E310646
QGTTDAYEVVLRRADGTPERIVRRTVPPVPVKGAYMDSLRRMQADDRSGLQALDALPLPDALPAFQRLLVDDGGALWVQRPTWPGTGVRPEWDVFDTEGKMLGTLRLPPRFRVTQVGADFILGVGLDDDDVQQVRMYRLEKPAAGR